ncbi:MAG: J domain-containing protein [Bryobacteraceae bacterium]
MNYYEELGVQHDATAGQIHQAYKTLARLLHPDSQTDETVKAVAGLQMRRLNGVLDTLLDPEKRRAYDESLGEADEGWRPPPPPRLYQAPREGGWPGLARAALRQWFWILTGLVIAGTAVWYAAYKDSALAEVASAPVAAPLVPDLSVPESRPPVRPAPVAPVAAEAGTAPESLSRVAAALDTGGSEPGPVPAELPSPNKDRRNPEGGVPLLTMALPPAPLPAVPASAAGAPESPEASLSGPDGGERQTSWGGNWLYAPQPEDGSEAGLYAPSYIEFLLVEEQGNLAGNYRARYRVPDKALSSEVGFRAEGKAPGGNLATLAWTSDEGAKGRVELTLRSPDLLKVTWWTTAFGRRAGLTSGTATLVRQRVR